MITGSNRDNPPLTKNSFYLPNLAEMVLQDVRSSFQENRTLTPDSYQQLNAIFPRIFIPALNVLDKYKFIKYRVSSETRCIYKLIRQSREYTLRENVNFCSCRYFIEKVLQKNDAFMCRHILALKMAEIIDKIQEEVISNAQMTQLLNNDVSNTIGFKGFSEDECEPEINQ